MVMDNDTIFEEESRFYVNPQTSLDEQTEFINTLRDIQAQNTAEINQNTYNLGSPVTSNIGGLTGSEGLWQAQYQTPQTQATVAGLKATMQQQALNTELQNRQNFWKNRYNQAQRRYNRAASTYPKNPTNPSEGDGLGIDTNTPTPAGDLTLEVAPVSVGETQQNQAAFENALANTVNSGNKATAGSQGLTYKQGDTTYYVTLYRDNLGKLQGGTLNTASGGRLVPVADYNVTGIGNLLNQIGRSGTKIYDMGGTDVTTSWSLM